MLIHLIVHAAYSHRLDCGPLLLADIDFLLRQISIDWPRFWARSTQEGWQRGARLVLELTHRYRAGARIDLGHGQCPAPALLAAAPDLLLQELETRQSAGFAAAATLHGPARLLARLTGRRSTKEGLVAARDMTHEGGFLGWARTRFVRTFSELAHSDVRRQSRRLAQISKWLDQ